MNVSTGVWKIPLRRYAILKNFVEKPTKPKVHPGAWEKFKPNHGQFDQINPIFDKPDWSYVDPVLYLHNI